ncbi:MAG: flagellar assembly peptidoglycan hydrolase FlgJ [Parashewanella sp.]
MEKLSNSSHFLDLGSINKLRSQAQQDEKGAIKEVAKQFEGIFVQMLMKSMRDANEVFKADSPFNTQYTAFYEQMRDQQLSVDLSNKGVLGLADLMVQQLSPEGTNIKPASVLRADAFTAKAVNASELDKSAAKVLHHPNVTGKPRHTVELPDIHSTTAAPSNAASTFSDPQSFIKQLFPMATEAASKIGTKPELLIAQSALETGWGKKIIRKSDGESANNLFNIKADKRWQGEKASVNTLEFEQGVAVKQKADFRVYDNLKQSFDDFVEFISSNERYQGALKVASEPKQFIEALQKAGYATDPNYASKVMQVMKTIREIN